MCNIEMDAAKSAKDLVKGILGDKGVNAVKKVLGKNSFLKILIDYRV